MIAVIIIVIITEITLVCYSNFAKRVPINYGKFIYLVLLSIFTLGESYMVVNFLKIIFIYIKFNKIRYLLYVLIMIKIW